MTTIEPPSALREHLDFPRSEARALQPSAVDSLAVEPVSPNWLVRLAFYASLFAVPFQSLYLPGTGEHVGVTRLVQVLMFLAALSQPRVCLRHLPVALLLFGSYFALTIVWGLWLSPRLWQLWWPDTLAFLQFHLPWLWFAFNVLQYRGIAQGGLAAFIAGASVCALFHLAGFGVGQVDVGSDWRTTVFGQNANVLGAIYGVALVATIGLAMLKRATARGRMMLLVSLGLVGTALARTGSRTAALLAVLGVFVLLFQTRSFAPRLKRYAMLFLVGVIMAGVLYQFPAVLKRFADLRSSDIQAREGRARMIPVLWEIFLRSPIIGGGPAAYEDELTRRAMAHRLHEKRTFSAHNLTLRILVETGLIGFSIFAMGVGMAVKAAWRARLSSCGLVPLALLAPLVVAGLISSDPSPNPVFWLAMAYALAGRL
jgi:O-antigen ligase